MYPTASAPQYAFGPGLAPVPMPGMASGGLASLPVKRFQSGGFSIGTAPASSGGSLDAFTSPVPGTPTLSTPVGTFGVSPSTLVGLAVPGLAAPLGLLGLGIKGYQALTAQQQPAPISVARTAEEVEAQQQQLMDDISAARDAEDAEQGLAMMNQMQAPQQQDISTPDISEAVTPGIAVTDQDVNVDPTAALTAMNVQQTEEQDPSTPDISDVAATVVAAQDAVDASNTTAAPAPAPAPASTTAGTGTDTGAGSGTPSIGDQQNVDANMNVQDAPDSGGGGAGGCFLTTAAVRHMGQKDNGEVLNTLRGFRDTYMQKDKEKNKDIQWYYTNAPRIMRALDARKDVGSVYREMYNDYILPAYKKIKAGKNAEAYTIYRRGVNFARRESGIDNDDLTPKPKHYMYGGQVMNYEQGGLAAAQQAQSKGRGQDTMLVHMTPGEVKGLQALAMSQGGSLTINPQTGLPEAGFLSSILPMIAGMALAPLTAGTSLAFLGATPFASALTVGGITGLATGSLKKGLMAGLGAYGGAGIGQGMSAAAGTAENLAAAAPAGMTPVPSAPAFTPDMSTLSGTGGDFLASAPQKTSLLNSSISAPAVTPTGIPAVTPQASMFSAANIPPPLPTGMDAFTGGTKAMLQTGAPGEAARSAFMKAAPVGSLTAAGTSLASALTPEPAPLQTSKTFIRPYDLDITNPSGMPQYTPQDTREREQVRHVYRPRAIYEAAQGGLTALNGQTYDDEYGRDEYASGGKVKQRSLKGNPYYKFADSRKDSSMEAAIEQNFAKGGLRAALPPRFLSGGGDGMSDSIKANIDGKQEARLADGEFVVPADVVSHLGNGSSKAGAKKLYAMMDKIRKARTGRERQAPEVNAQRYMPA